MGDKGKRDKGKRKEQKKNKQTLKENLIRDDPSLSRLSLASRYQEA